MDPLSFQSGATFFFDDDHFKDPTPAIGNPIDVTYISYTPEAHAQVMHIASWRSINLASTARGQYRFDHAKISRRYHPPLPWEAIPGIPAHFFWKRWSDFSATGLYYLLRYVWRRQPPGNFGRAGASDCRGNRCHG